MTQTPEIEIPSMNPADRDSVNGTIRLILTKFLQDVDDMLPARVISYDRASNRAKVQPLIVVITTSNEQVQRAEIASVPVLQLGGGGFVLSFPIKAGDIGWIKANDRDISLFKQFLDTAPPNTQRKHSFSDAVFIPDTMLRGVTIEGEDADNVVLQSIDGTQRIAIASDHIKITATNIVLNATEKVLIDTPLTEITGQLISGTNSGYTQTASFNGNITTTADVIADTISLRTHVHNGVQTGAGDTGEPVP